MIGLKERQYYSDSFKKGVVEEVLSGKISKEEARKKYNLKGKCAVLKWIRTFDKIEASVKKEEQEYLISEMKENSANTEDLQKRIKELEKALEEATLKADAYSTMIDIAEKDLKINIRKKSSTKQSRK